MSAKNRIKPYEIAYQVDHEGLDAFKIVSAGYIRPCFHKNMASLSGLLQLIVYG